MVSVVGEMFCNPYTTELVVRRRRESLRKDLFEVFDLSDNLIFTVDGGGSWNIRRKRVLHDANGTPLLSMRTKGLITMRYKWEVYKGESIESEDLLFSAREPNLLSFKTSLDVSLPPQQHSSDTDHTKPDFQTFGRYIGSSFKLFEPIHNTLLAEVVHDFSLGGLILGKYSFKVRINPYVDYAFVIALLVIADDTTNLR